MIEIGIFILLPKEIDEYVSSWKKLFFKEFGYQNYLNHIPHITLSNFLTNEVQEVSYIIENLSKCVQGYIELEINKVSYFESESYMTPYIKICKNKKLIDFQKNTVYKTANYIFPKFNENFENKIYQYNNNKFNYPYVGNSWIPHITIGEIEIKHKDATLTKKFLNEKINERFIVDSINIFEIKKDKHSILNKFYV